MSGQLRSELLKNFDEGFVGTMADGQVYYWLTEEAARRDSVNFYPAWVPHGAEVRS